MKYTPDILGPRVIFKDDRDSSIGRGCQLFATHFVPVMMEMLRHCIQAFANNKAVAVVRVTEGWRSIRTSRDLHEDCRALDFTAELASGARVPIDVYASVAAQMRRWLGQDFDVIVHGQGSNLHIHVEYDPKTGRATA